MENFLKAGYVSRYTNSDDDCEFDINVMSFSFYIDKIKISKFALKLDIECSLFRRR